MAREKQKVRSMELRDAILDAALTLALEDGMENLSIRKISGAMGYSTGILYYHYKDKDAIIDAIQEREGKALRQMILSVTSPDATAAENLRAAFHEIMLLAHREADKYNLIVRNRHGRKEKQRNGMMDLLCDLIRQGALRGELAVEDIDRTAFAIWSSFLGFHMVISQLSDFIPLEEAEARFEIQYQILMKGIGVSRRTK